MSESEPPRPLTLEDFASHVEAVFTADCTPRNVALTLVEAYPLKNHARAERAPFMLIFRSDPAIFLGEGSYVLQADGIAPAAIDLMPTTPAPGAAPGYYYQAVFG